MASYDTCCVLCSGNDACLAWTWEADAQTCFLKDDIFYRFEKRTATSGLSGRPSVYGNGSIARACATANSSAWPFCDPGLGTQARVADLIGRLTLAEKAAMMTARESPGGGVARLGVPEVRETSLVMHISSL